MHVRRSHGLSNSYFSAHYFKCTRDNFAMPNEMKYFLMQTAATAACFEKEMNCSNNTTTTKKIHEHYWLERVALGELLLLNMIYILNDHLT